MKKIKTALIIVAIAGISSFAYAEPWYCEADCGTTTTRDIGGAFTYHLNPVYYGHRVYGEGATFTEAFNTMKSSCDAYLHLGFEVYNPMSFIKLNTRVSPTQVCRKL